MNLWNDRNTVGQTWPAEASARCRVAAAHGTAARRQSFCPPVLHGACAATPAYLVSLAGSLCRYLGQKQALHATEAANAAKACGAPKPNSAEASKLHQKLHQHETCFTEGLPTLDTLGSPSHPHPRPAGRLGTPSASSPSAVQGMGALRPPAALGGLASAGPGSTAATEAK